MGEDNQEEQRLKKIAATSYDYDNDSRWADYWSNILIPPHLSSRSDVIHHFKHKFYHRYIDPGLVVDPMSSTGSQSSSSATGPTRTRSSGSSAITTAPTSLRWDAWVNVNSSDDTAASRGSDEAKEKSSEKKTNGSSSSVEMSLGELERKKMKRYSSGELTSITENFTNEIGSGAYGDVFKGTLPNGLQVAVKKLKNTAVNVMESTFMAEMRTMSSTLHRNLVRLYGYCFEDNMKALVYEYLENGSLDKVLYDNHLNLRWENLYEIAIGTAKGLSYLHESCDDEIVHYDVKPENVLLDSKLSPKVADFGLSKISQMDSSHISVIEFRGTRSFAAPEMWMQMPVTPKSDVYSFGMMLFEILRRGSNRDGQEWFPGHVWEKFKNGQLDDIIEYCGIEEKNKVNAKILSTTALWCTQYRPSERPTMGVVVQVLKGNIQLKSPPDPLYPYTVSSGTRSLGGGST